MEELIKLAIASILGGGTVAAIIGLLGDRLKRKDAKEDREEAKKDRSEKNGEEIAKMQTEEAERNVALEDRLKGIENQIESRSGTTQKQIGELTEAIRLILFDRLIQFGEYLVTQGEVTFDQRHRFGEMHKMYHETLKGNGDADFLKAAVDRLPMKYSEGEKPHY